VTISLRERGVRGVVLDIEGTTTPISFVTDTLFPYADEHLPSYLASHAGQAEVEEAVRLLKQEWEDDVAHGLNPPPRDSAQWVTGYARWLMRQDRKSPGLKLLQGLIWEGGYADGSLRGSVYPDVPPALSRWQQAGLAIAIYSSGSVLAQRLLFSTTAYGDLTRFVSTYFDTGVGPKREAVSYERIAAAMALPPAALLFVSDVIAEVEAARSAGMQAVHCLRDGDADIGTSHPDAVRSFDAIVD
jgi:enolase-phosphatase E1